MIKTIELEDKEIDTILVSLGMMSGQFIKNPGFSGILRMADHDHITHEHILELAEKLKKDSTKL